VQRSHFLDTHRDEPKIGGFWPKTYKPARGLCKGLLTTYRMITSFMSRRIIIEMGNDKIISRQSLIMSIAWILTLIIISLGCSSGGESDSLTGNNSGNNEVTLGKRIIFDLVNPQLVEIRNRSDFSATFSLIHNGQRVEPSINAVIESVSDLPEQFEGETIEHKLWRFIREGVYHWCPISKEKWLHDPLLLINSIGFGFCDDVASIFAQLSKAAGYESRVWYLNGHIVPEVMTNGIWSMYDPDLSVYYKKTGGRIASVTDLEDDPTLITSPIEPIFQTMNENEMAYSPMLADIYQTKYDNFVSDWYIHDIPHIGALFNLPPGASLCYPGIWVAKPFGVCESGLVEAPEIANLRIDLPNGSYGKIRLPLMLRTVVGDGEIRIDDQVFYIGSPELETYLESNVAETIETIPSSPNVALIFYLNPMRFYMTGDDYIQLEGINLSALEIRGLSTDKKFILTEDLINVLRKPVPSSLD
jgi:hypothetical protein